MLMCACCSRSIVSFALGSKTCVFAGTVVAEGEMP